MIALNFRWPCWFSANVFCFAIQMKSSYRHLSIITGVSTVCVCVCVQGVNLALAKEKGQLVFLEGLNESLSVLIPQESHADSCALGFLRYTDAPHTSPLRLLSSSQ